MEPKQIPIQHDLDIFAARRAAREMAQTLGFGLVESTAIETAVSELATNVLRHAGGGALTLRPLTDQTPGLEVNCEDQGPGIADVEVALRDGQTDGTGLGIGLGGVKRLMDEMEIQSQLGNGTCVTARKWAAGGGGVGKQGSKGGGGQERNRALSEDEGRQHASRFTHHETRNLHLTPWNFQVAAASRPAAGETANGDAFLVRDDDCRLLVALVDGLGHGDEAAAVAQRTLACIERYSRQSLTDLLQRCHTELQGTRGAALGLTRLDPGASTLTYAGIGNTGIRLANPNPARPISLSGIVGYTMRRVREETFPCTPGDLIVMYTDGVSDHFDLEALLRQTPDLRDLVGRLVAEYGRENDDTTAIGIRVRKEVAA
jgi:anti-sigma regulatory factor (Ser/Thr protein kinase)